MDKIEKFETLLVVKILPITKCEVVKIIISVQT